MAKKRCTAKTMYLDGQKITRVTATVWAQTNAGALQRVRNWHQLPDDADVIVAPPWATSPAVAEATGCSMPAQKAAARGRAGRNHKPSKAFNVQQRIARARLLRSPAEWEDRTLLLFTKFPSAMGDLQITPPAVLTQLTDTVLDSNEHLDKGPGCKYLKSLLSQQALRKDDYDRLVKELFDFTDTTKSAVVLSTVLLSVVTHPHATEDVVDTAARLYAKVGKRTTVYLMDSPLLKDVATLEFVRDNAQGATEEAVFFGPVPEAWCDDAASHVGAYKEGTSSKRRSYLRSPALRQRHLQAVTEGAAELRTRAAAGLLDNLGPDDAKVLEDALAVLLNESVDTESLQQLDELVKAIMEEGDIHPEKQIRSSLSEASRRLITNPQLVPYLYGTALLDACVARNSATAPGRLEGLWDAAPMLYNYHVTALVANPSTPERVRAEIVTACDAAAGFHDTAGGAGPYDDDRCYVVLDHVTDFLNGADELSAEVVAAIESNDNISHRILEDLHPSVAIPRRTLYRLVDSATEAGQDVSGLVHKFSTSRPSTRYSTPVDTSTDRVICEELLLSGLTVQQLTSAVDIAKGWRGTIGQLVTSAGAAGDPL